MNETIYRKVETEITWQDELVEFLKSKEITGEVRYPFSDDESLVYLDAQMSSDKFIEMCSLVHNANNN